MGNFTRTTPLILLLGGLVGAEPASTVLVEDFSDPAAVAKVWRGPGSADDGGWRITLPAVGSAKASASIPAGSIAGRTVRLSARVRSEAVSPRPQAWNGVKVLLALVDATGGKSYPQLATVDGTRPWTVLEKNLVIPADVAKADVVIGLENVSGSVWFDDVRVEVVGQ